MPAVLRLLARVRCVLSLLTDSICAPVLFRNRPLWPRPVLHLYTCARANRGL